jgi:hypothetical protein
MRRTIRGRSRPTRRRRTPLVGLCVAVALAAGACGGGDDCSGFISVNASPAECEALAERFGCSGFDVEGPGGCGLLGCVSCGDLNPQDGDS